MSSRFEAEIQQLERFTYVKIRGPIDEDNELAPLVGRVRGETAIFDLGGVDEINNCGVRDWVRTLEELQARQVAVVLVECSPAIVAKLNSVGNFITGGHVKSFYVPYYCQACEQERAMLVDVAELDGQDEPRAPTCRCDRCDGIMAFDDLEETFFGFVSRVGAASPPGEVSELLERLQPAAGERKVVARTGAGSSFSGIPSTVSSSGGFDTGVRSSAPASAATLRRLRDKTGLRTLRPTADEDAGPRGRGRGKLALVIALAALGVVALVIGVLGLLRLLG